MASGPRYFIDAQEGAKLINDHTWLGTAVGLAFRNPWLTIAGAGAGSMVGYVRGKHQEEKGVIVSPPRWLNIGALTGLLIGVAALGPMIVAGAFMGSFVGMVFGGISGAAAVGAGLTGAFSLAAGTYYGADHSYRKMETNYEVAKRIGVPLDGDNLQQAAPKVASRLDPYYHAASPASPTPPPARPRSTTIPNPPSSPSTLMDRFRAWRSGASADVGHDSAARRATMEEGDDVPDMSGDAIAKHEHPQVTQRPSPDAHVDGHVQRLQDRGHVPGGSTSSVQGDTASEDWVSRTGSQPAAHEHGFAQQHLNQRDTDTPHREGMEL